MRPGSDPEAPKSIMSTSTETIEELATREYKYGFVTDVEAEAIPAGLNEDIVRMISAKKHEPEWLLEWRLKAYRVWLKMKEPTWHNLKINPIDYQSIIYYSAPKQKPSLKSLDEVDPEVRKTFEKLGIPIDEQKMLSGIAVDAVFDSVSVATTFKKQLADVGIIFCSFSEAVQHHPDLVKKYLGSVVPHTDNFYAALNSAVFTDGSFAYIPKGVRCPMELSTYFRINAKGSGQFERTLIVAEEGSLCQLPRGLHGADARREPAARGCRRARGARQRHDQVFDHPELVSGRQRRQGRDLQLRDQARQLPGRQLEDHVDAGRDRLGHHLEVSELHSAGRQLGRRVLLGRDDQQQAAGGHRHEDDPSREEHAQHDRLEGHLGRQGPEYLPRPGENREEGRRARATTRSATRCSSATSAARTRSRTSRSATASAKVEHEASTSKIGEDQIFYLRQRGLSAEDAVNMIVNGFCKDVFRELPMEFAVEAQKLLGISLEGSVG